MGYELLDDSAASPPPAPNTAGRYVVLDDTAAESRQKPATWQDRVQASGAGLWRGGLYLGASPADAVANVYNLAKAGTGYVAGQAMATPSEDLPERTPGGLYRFQLPTGETAFSKNPPPAGAQPAHSYAQPNTPSFLQDVAGPSPFGAAAIDAWKPAALNRPDDRASRYISAATSVIPGATVSGGGAPSIAQALLRTGKTAAAAAVPVSVGQAVGEAQPFGDNDAANNTAQIAAQLLSGQVQPAAAAGLRGAIRGGEAGRQQMGANIASFRAAGAQPTLGQASGARVPQAIESALAKIPGSAGVMQHAAEQQAGDISGGVDRLAAGLSPNGASAERAGRAIESGVTGEGGFRDQFRGTSQQLFGQFDQHIPPTAPINVGNTLATLDTLSKPSPGAPATSALLANPRVSAIRNALQTDTAANGTLPYESLSRIRSQVGGMLSGNELISDIPRAQLKQLYGAISSDMETAARSAGPDAYQAYSRAQNYYKAGLDRLDTLSDVVDKGGPESVLNAAMSGTRDGASRLRSVMQSLQPGDQQTVAATVLNRLGRATPGQQNADGTAFSTQTFLTNWNRMSPEAKTALFDRFPDNLRGKIDNIASVTSNLRDGSKVFANPSGTTAAGHATSALASVLGAGIIGHDMGGIKGMTIGVGGALGTAGAANLAARAVTSPKVVDWAARPTTLFGFGQKAALIASPANLSNADQQRRALAQALMNQPNDSSR